MEDGDFEDGIEEFVASNKKPEVGVEELVSSNFDNCKAQVEYGNESSKVESISGVRGGS